MVDILVVQFLGSLQQILGCPNINIPLYTPIWRLCCVTACLLYLTDESEEVESRCQEVIREMEKTLGEPLQKYF